MINDRKEIRLIRYHYQGVCIKSFLSNASHLSNNSFTFGINRMFSCLITKNGKKWS